MRRQIIFDADGEQEGLCYDLDRAWKEGLYEEMRLFLVAPDDALMEGESNRIEVAVTEELMEALAKALDLSVNIGPDEVQNVTLELRYVYDYGQAGDPEGATI